MDYTPYEESLAAINGLPVDLESKPATDFATYIQTLLDNPAPRGFMLSGRAPATAEEELELKKAGEVVNKLVPPSMFSEGGGEAAPTSNTPGISLGIGSLTDAHNQSVVQSAIQGFMTGGIPGAITNAIESHVVGLFGNLSYINDMPDPLGTLSALQGWSPVPVVDLNTYSPEAIAEANNNEANQMAVDPGVVAAVAANDAAVNAAAAEALGVEGIGIDAFGGPGPSVGPTSEAASSSGGDSGAGCCFIMLEARYGDGTMDSVVRKYRDEMMTDKNRRGYYKLAEVFVPLMRKSKVFKFLVKKTFADPLVSYGQWHYNKNKHGWLFTPLKNLWMKVFNILGSDTQFIRENGEVV